VTEREIDMFGLIGQMRAQTGKREVLVEILLRGTREMPGCLSYIVAKDLTDPDAIWITEVWDDETSHAASLSLPSVQAAISEARPHIAGFDSSTRIEPVGGVGIPSVEPS